MGTSATLLQRCGRHSMGGVFVVCSEMSVRVWVVPPRATEWSMDHCFGSWPRWCITAAGARESSVHTPNVRELGPFLAP